MYYQFGDLVSNVKIWVHFYKTNYITNQRNQNMLIKVNLLFLYSSMEKNRKDSADF